MAENQSTLAPSSKVVVIGGSAGSIEAVLQIFRELNPFNNFSLVIILHRKEFQQSDLAGLFSYHSPVPTTEIEDKWPLNNGEIYLAPADYHLLFEKDKTMTVDLSEKVNHSRPSIDVSFESAARTYGENTIGIILSGANHDGAKGLLTIKEAGGTTIVQSPIEATYPFMPRAAIREKAADHLFSCSQIAAYLNQIA